MDNYPADARMIIGVEHPASGAQLRLTDVDDRQVTAFNTNRPGQANKLDLTHRGRGRCEQRIKDLKDQGLNSMPHKSFAANQIWLTTVILAGALSVWARLLGAGDEAVAAAGRSATDARNNGYDEPNQHGKSNSRWWLWSPGKIRTRLVSTAAIVARHARQVRVRCDGAAAHCALLVQALSRIRALAG